MILSMLLAPVVLSATLVSSSVAPVKITASTASISITVKMKNTTDKTGMSIRWFYLGRLIQASNIPSASSAVTKSPTLTKSGKRLKGRWSAVISDCAGNSIIHEFVVL